MHAHLHEPAASHESRSSDPSEAIAYSPQQASDVSSLSLRTITAAIASGQLRSFKRGRRRIIFRTDLDTYLRSEGDNRIQRTNVSESSDSISHGASRTSEREA